jgi:hypothetical protein
MAVPAPPPFLARKDLFRLSSCVTSKLNLASRAQVIDKGNNRVQVVITNYINLSDCLVTATQKAEYCSKIECSGIGLDPTRAEVIKRLQAYEGEFDAGISRLKPLSITLPGLPQEANKNNIPHAYTALYLAYLYSLSKAPSCPKGGVAKEAEQCITYVYPGKTTAQVFGGGRKPRRGASRQKLRSSRRATRKHTRRSRSSSRHSKKH